MMRRKHKEDSSEDDAILSKIYEESTQESIFETPYVVKEWPESGTTTKRLSVATILLSSVLSGKFLVHVAEDGCVFEVRYVGPIC